MKPKFFLIAAALFLTVAKLSAVEPLAAGVRGVATRAPKGMKIDGDLSPFKDAMCTPLEYFNDDLKNRAVQFLYMWDDEAFYAAMRTLDTKPANNADDNHLWEGDAVEWYFDTPGEEHFRGTNWGPGAVKVFLARRVEI